MGFFFRFKCLSPLPNRQSFHSRDLILIIFVYLLLTALPLTWQEQSSRVNRTRARCQIQCQAEGSGRHRARFGKDGSLQDQGPAGCTPTSPPLSAVLSVDQAWWMHCVLELQERGLTPLLLSCFFFLRVGGGVQARASVSYATVTTTDLLA